MPTLRAAGLQDLPAIRTVLARSYHRNPLMRWVLPDAATRDDACAAWLAPSLERYVLDGVVHVAEVNGAVVAAAAWMPPGGGAGAGAGAGAQRTTSLPTSAGVLAALVGTERAAGVRAALGSSAPLFPSTPSAYLNYLGVAPEHQRRGLGGALVRHGVAALVDETQGAHLGTTDPDNVGFYTALGFVSRGVVRLDDPRPTLEILAMPPQSGRQPAADLAGSANQTFVSP